MPLVFLGGLAWVTTPTMEHMPIDSCESGLREYSPRSAEYSGNVIAAGGNEEESEREKF